MWLWYTMFIKLNLVTISTELGRTATAVSTDVPVLSPLCILPIYLFLLQYNKIPKDLALQMRIALWKEHILCHNNEKI